MKSLFNMLTFTQAWRFLLVGLVNTGVGYSIYFVLLQFAFSPGLALAIATSIGALFNYFSTGRLVFNLTSWNRIIHFFLAYLFIYLVNWGALTFLLSMEFSPELAQALLLPMIAVLSFVIFKFIVFRDHTVDPDLRTENGIR